MGFIILLIHYFQQALCAPSRNSMLTSRRPDTLHLYDFYNYWRDFSGNYTTLPQYLKSYGYHTESIGKIFHPGITSNYTDDFPLSWSIPTFHPSTEIYKNSPVCFSKGHLKKNLLCPVDIEMQPEGTLPDIQSMQEAKKRLLQHKVDLNPFFLAVGFHKPHVPFKFPIKYLDYYNPESFEYARDQYRPYLVPDVAFNPYNDFRDREDVKELKVEFPFGPIPSNFSKKIRQHYYAAVSYVDDLIGQLIENMDSKTVIILTSDHGFQLGEHADWEKYSNYETALKVPLIIYDPYKNLATSKKIDNVVELIDLFPTIVDLIGLPEIEKCHQSVNKQELCTEGKSLVPLMDNNSKSWENIAFSQYPRPGEFPTKSPNSDKPKLKQIKIMGYSIRTAQFRYNVWIKFNSKKFKRGILINNKLQFNINYLKLFIYRLE